MIGYRNDLAYIHDAGFTGYLRQSAPGILATFRRHGITSGLVADLGCGSGRWAAELNRAGYQCIGIDQSEAMLRLARVTAPDSTFIRGYMLDAPLPKQCDAITSISECISYAIDSRVGPRSLSWTRFC